MKKYALIFLIFIATTTALATQDFQNAWVFDSGEHTINLNEAMIDPDSGDLILNYDLDFQTSQGWRFSFYSMTPTLFSFIRDEKKLLVNGERVDAANPGISLIRNELSVGDIKRDSLAGTVRAEQFLAEGERFLVASAICKNPNFLAMLDGTFIWGQEDFINAEGNQQCCADLVGEVTGFYVAMVAEFEYQTRAVEINDLSIQTYDFQFRHPVDLKALCSSA